MKTRTHRFLIILGTTLIIGGCLGLIANYFYQVCAITFTNVDYVNYRGADTTNLVTQSIVDTNDNLTKAKKTMNSNNLSTLLNTLVLLAGLLLNPILLKVLRKVNSFDQSNNTQHNEIINELKTFKTKRDIIIGLREILNHCLESCPDQLSKFINFEGELIISFATEMMESKFDFTSIQQIDVKIDSCIEDAQEYVSDLSPEFQKKFTEILEIGVNKFRVDIKEIVLDKVFNSKHNRFRMSCEQFMHNHLTSIIRIYNN